VNALYRLRITDQLFKSYVFARVVRSQSTLQRLLRRQILKNTLYIVIPTCCTRQSILEREGLKHDERSEECPKGTSSTTCLVKPV
jgi:ABC-type antimicrobial peptide transport system permease subunit